MDKNSIGSPTGKNKPRTSRSQGETLPIILSPISSYVKLAVRDERLLCVTGILRDSIDMI